MITSSEKKWRDRERESEVYFSYTHTELPETDERSCRRILYRAGRLIRVNATNRRIFASIVGWKIPREWTRRTREFRSIAVRWRAVSLLTFGERVSQKFTLLHVPARITRVKRISFFWKFELDRRRRDLWQPRNSSFPTFQDIRAIFLFLCVSFFFRFSFLFFVSFENTSARSMCVSTSELQSSTPEEYLDGWILADETGLRDGSLPVERDGCFPAEARVDDRRDLLLFLQRLLLVSRMFQ